MERLTHETFSCMRDFCTETECEMYAECPALERYNRLKAYEDTDLSPEEVRALKEGCEDCEIARRDWELSHEFPNLDHLRELVKTEKEGRLLVLPCPIGSTVYVIGHKYRDGWDEEGGAKAFLCVACRKRRLSEAAKARNLNKLGNASRSKRQARRNKG